MTDKEKTKKEDCVMYLRTSTTDQNPDLQYKDCEKFCEENNLEIEGWEEEQVSAYQMNKKRPKWEEVKEYAIENKCHIVVWRYDRAFRNRKEFVKFMRSMYEVHGIKVFSVQEQWVNTLWSMIDNLPDIPEPFDEVIEGLLKELWKALIQIVGSMAEDESKKRSERVKLSIKRDEHGNLVSASGKRWGKPTLVTQRLKQEVEQLKAEGKTIRQIAKLVYVYDKNNNKKNISKSLVHKILSGQIYPNEPKKIKLS